MTSFLMSCCVRLCVERSGSKSTHVYSCLKFASVYIILPFKLQQNTQHIRLVRILNKRHSSFICTSVACVLSAGPPEQLAATATTNYRHIPPSVNETWAPRVRS